MAYDARVYRVLIASPSDVEEERDTAVKVIQEWNDLYSYSRKIVLLPLRWETHTAPDYGTRPQEVINRAIVDECDLLIGVFWTRIGSPTGAADSGTLEEIQRVGNSGKPVMLYFSKVGIEPDRIDMAQLEKLKEFKKQTYPKGLVESYSKYSEFRDKFARQLEMKVRELQKNDTISVGPTMSLEFLSLDEETAPVGNKIRYESKQVEITSYEPAPIEKRDRIKTITERVLKSKNYVPVALAIKNSSPSGVRNLYVELDFVSTSRELELTQTPTEDRGWVYPWDHSDVKTETTRHLSKFDPDLLQKTESGWRVVFEWDALQPQRVRLVRPILYAYTKEPTSITISARVFSENLREPQTLRAELEIATERTSANLSDTFPDWENILEEDEQSKNVFFAPYLRFKDGLKGN